jgi:hypothetical protein
MPSFVTFAGQQTPEAQVQKGGYKRETAYAAKNLAIDAKCNNEELRKIMEEVGWNDNGVDSTNYITAFVSVGHR